MSESRDDTAPDRRARLREVAAVFTKLGLTGFGGPAVHVAMMEEELVHRRKWLDRQHFLDLLSAVNFIPGPNSTEMAIHLGLIRAGFAGLVVGGFCFIAPAVLIILPIAWVYVKFGSLPQVQPAFRGIGAAVAAIVIVATWRLIKHHRKSCFSFTLVASSTIAYFVFRRFNVPQPDLLILLAAGVIGLVRMWVLSRVRFKLFSFAPLAILTQTEMQGLVQTTLLFLKIGITLFGSGYVLVTYLQTELVDHRHWLTQQQMLDSIAVGQVTPGPLLTTATFIGYLLGSSHFGTSPASGALFAVTATAAIFLPAFILIAVLAPTLDKLRQYAPARMVFDALNDGVIGLLVATSMQLVWTVCIRREIQTMHFNWVPMMLMSGASVALLRNINSTWIIICAGLLASGLYFWGIPL